MAINSNSSREPNNRTVGRGVFYAVRADVINEVKLQFQESLGTALRRVGSWCEMAASLAVRAISEL
jgi:hypothetical protein